MKVVQAGFEIMDPLNGEEILKKIERVARVCYKSEGMICKGSAEKMVRGLVKRGHEAMLEHFSFVAVMKCNDNTTYVILEKVVKP